MKQVSKILLPLSSVRNADAALIIGRNFARRFKAHLAVLHVRPDGRDIAPLAGEGLTGGMVEDLMSAAEREGARRTREVQEVFETFAAHAGIAVVPPRIPFPQDEASVSFNVIKGSESEIVPFHARLSDFTLVAHPDSGDEVSSSEALHAVLFDSGRPAVIAPREPMAHMVKRVCIAWNGTAEAASALRGVIAWASTAERVRVLHCGDYQRRGPEAREVVDYLSMHNITADRVEFAPVERDVGKGLLAACKDFEADMLAMGAYSHSRLRQLILGGVTRHVLEHATLPVLMSR
ncbi:MULTISPECIES: universal stress protein [Acetobacter]|uniref:Universal stress protein UspA n=2 Tax=Acetobacter TaxID=434 RepID=A0A511XE37_9PROT|nr:MULTISPECIES: universal stress protein [Acetobacter]MBO1359611.1 universal stress protein [Acetobacter sacchari]GEN61217.1 universal stress protein UspA [Acetobacter nitrogenifigens DSM 23921 = NBRC 105050]